MSTTPSILISLNCSSRSLSAAYLSADGVEFMDELELNVLEEDNELTEPTDIGRPSKEEINHWLFRFTNQIYLLKFKKINKGNLNSSIKRITQTKNSSKTKEKNTPCNKELKTGRKTKTCYIPIS